MAMADKGEKTLRWLTALFSGQVAAFVMLLSSMLVLRTGWRQVLHQ